MWKGTWHVGQITSYFKSLIILQAMRTEMNKEKPRWESVDSIMKTYSPKTRCDTLRMLNLVIKTPLNGLPILRNCFVQRRSLFDSHTKCFDKF